MRVGMSWPTGHGRRAFISVGPVALLLLLPFWLTWLVIYAAVMLLVAVGHLIGELRA